MIEHFSAFPEDFETLKDAENSTETEPCEILSCSNYSIDQTISSFTIAKDCILYCAAEENCRSCIKVCNPADKTICERRGTSKIATRQILSEKPGNVIAYFVGDSSLSNYLLMFRDIRCVCHFLLFR